MLVKVDHVIEQFSSAAADPPLHDAIKRSHLLTERYILNHQVSTRSESRPQNTENK